MSGLNTFDRACYGWHCSDAKTCKHKRDQAETKAQFYYRVYQSDPCPYYDPKPGNPQDVSWGMGADPHD